VVRDGQCPRDLKWIKGNITTHWIPTENDPMKNLGEGGQGVCCVELDLRAANRMSAQLMPHLMLVLSPWLFVTGTLSVAWIPREGHRDKGLTDRRGGYMTPDVFGHKKFYVPGRNFTINADKPFTILTKFCVKKGEILWEAP
jgi:hypothetical protein